MSTTTNEREVTALASASPAAGSRVRKPYAKPSLMPLGDIRDITLAGSLGTNESGMMSTRRP